jgi:histidyl-tRNA synthetase
VLYIEPAGRQAVGIASTLRQKGIAVRIDLAGRPLKKQMSAASDSRFAVIVGPEETREGRVVLRDMQSRVESRIPIEDLLRDPGLALRPQRPG